jgi:hypothetical protein
MIRNNRPGLVVEVWENGQGSIAVVEIAYFGLCRCGGRETINMNGRSQEDEVALLRRMEEGEYDAGKKD